MTKKQKITPLDEFTLLTLHDVKKITQLGETFLRSEIRKGNLPSHKFGNAIRVRKADLDDWIKQQAVAA